MVKLKVAATTEATKEELVAIFVTEKCLQTVFVLLKLGQTRGKGLWIDFSSKQALKASFSTKAKVGFSGPHSNLLV